METTEGDFREGDIVCAKRQGKAKHTAWRVVHTRPAPGGGSVLVTEHVETGALNEWFEGDVILIEREPSGLPPEIAEKFAVRRLEGMRRTFAYESGRRQDIDAIDFALSRIAAHPAS